MLRASNISASLVSDETIKEHDEENYNSQLSPELMKGLAEYAVKEHCASHCIPHEQIENSIMEEMGLK